MKGPILVIMAAGMGSRYGGLKQIDPMGPNGEIIMDYSVYDAINAGFGKVVFVVKKETEEIFRDKIGRKIEELVDTAYAYQQIEDLPAGFQVPEGRIKPWGTAHAVLSCRDVVDRPFAVINADDFYGRYSFQVLGDFLKNVESKKRPYPFCMVGFRVENTLTEHGHVSRGVCTVSADGSLQSIQERTKIQPFGKVVKYTEDDIVWKDIPEGSMVSMNAWGFTTELFDELKDKFHIFLQSNKNNSIKSELYLPSVVDELILEGKATVMVLPCKERWYGVTYQEDKPVVKQALKQMLDLGIYPQNLWEDFKKGSF